jgi:hypothetical protein
MYNAGGVSFYLLFEKHMVKKKKTLHTIFPAVSSALLTGYKERINFFMVSL